MWSEAGFTLTALEEHDCARAGLMSAGEHGEHRLSQRPERLPCTTLQAWLDLP